MRVPTMEAENPASLSCGQHLRLAGRLADMLPGAAAVQVGLADPRRQWPHPQAVAVAADGARIPLNRPTSQIVARWAIRTWPEADWMDLHILDLATGQLTAGVGATARGR